MMSEQIKQLRASVLSKLDPKQRQWALLVSIGLGFGAVMYAMFAISDKTPPAAAVVDPVGIIPVKKDVSPIMATGQAVRPADAWISKAGQELDQLRRDRENEKLRLAQQEKTNKEMLARFEELNKKLAQPVAQAPVPAAAASDTRVATAVPARNLPPLPPPPRPRNGADNSGPMAMPFGEPGAGPYGSPASTLVRVSMSDAAAVPPTLAAAVPAQGAQGGDAGRGASRNLDNFLPISFTKAVLLGGLDAPTGGHSQTNPHPVLLRLEDNAVLPNRFRGQVRECFVVGAGYGDLSSERAYIRTEKLSCMRNDGTVMEISIKGSIFGEDGKVGVRGRLVSKQGQVLANALIAGVISGIGSGVQASFTNTQTSALGTVQTTDPNHALQAGMGAGFSKAMDRMAQYYITLAEKMFPIIEVDAGRLVDVVLTEGAVLEMPLGAGAGPGPGRTSRGNDNNSSSYYPVRGTPTRTIGASNDD